MRVSRHELGAVSLLFLVACSGFPFLGRKPADHEVMKADARISPQVRLEVQDIQYDGLTLSARVLVSPESGPLRLNRQLVPNIHVELWGVSDCKYGAVGSIRVDLIPRKVRPEDLLVLEPGYWFGRTVHFGPFDEHLTGLGPECIEAYIRLFSFDGKPVARQRIRAVRPPTQAVDGGIPRDEGLWIDPPPAEDAGSP
jgi:hypothetical protein